MSKPIGFIEYFFTIYQNSGHIPIKILKMDHQFNTIDILCYLESIHILCHLKNTNMLVAAISSAKSKKLVYGYMPWVMLSQNSMSFLINIYRGKLLILNGLEFNMIS